ncbi:MAG: hypothetical protein Q8R00_03680 [Candidatus Nanoarchaeia archaeon]|nr:hypothetical protein [Candidatus Nanoarchaeia archaeon]
MSYLNKKGAWEFENVGMLIIVLISAVVLILVVVFLYEGVGGKGEEFSCRQSIEAASRSKDIPTVKGTGRPTVKLDCSRNELMIKKADVVTGDKIDQDAAHQIIADAMLSCWNKVGAGKIDPFSNWDDDGLSYCLICDTVLFDDDLKAWMTSGIKPGMDETKIKEIVNQRSIKGMTSYLMTHSPSGKEDSYYELFYRAERGDLEAAKNADETSIILPGTSVLVNMYKPESKSSANVYGLAIAGGIVLVGSAILTGGLTLAVFGATSAGYGMIAAMGGGAAFAAFSGGYAIYTSASKAFADCPKCKGVGGISVLPSEGAFDQKIKIKDGDNEVETKLCDIIVN